MCFCWCICRKGTLNFRLRRSSFKATISIGIVYTHAISYKNIIYIYIHIFLYYIHITVITHLKNKAISFPCFLIDLPSNSLGELRPGHVGLKTVHCMDVDWHQVQCLAGQSCPVAMEVSWLGGWIQRWSYKETIHFNAFYIILYYCNLNGSAVQAIFVQSFQSWDFVFKLAILLNSFFG